MTERNLSARVIATFAPYFFLGISAVVIVLRYPPFLLSPRLWAEESIYFETFFSAGNWWEGFDALVYPEYYLLIPRMAGFIASLGDPSGAALVTTVTGLVALLLPLAIIFFGNSKYWGTVSQKLFLAGFLIFSCSTGELWLNSTNAGFILAVVTFLILLDELPGSYAKRLFYGLCLTLAILSGPVSLFMAPLFLYRYIERKEHHVLVYCILFLLLGAFQVAYFIVCQGLDSPIGSDSRGLWVLDNPNSSFFYWVSPNIIFPFFGYFAATGFRAAMVLADTDPLALLNFIGTLPAPAIHLTHFLTQHLSYVSLLLLIAFLLLFHHEWSRSGHETRIYIMLPFIALSLLLTALSLGGEGGYRYAYLCAFILLFYFLQKFHNQPPGGERTFIRRLLALSIVIGVLEYYPRVISYTPEFRDPQSEPWPAWTEEVARWRESPGYRPRVWPYLRSGDGPWPARTAVWRVNLETPEHWDKAGHLRFSQAVVHLLNSKSRQ